jgi:mono/diheme cytochrome c family protein
MFNAAEATRHATKSASGILTLAAGLTATLLMTAAVIVAAPKPASATPAYAAQTGYSCGRCHVSASGGGKLTSFGRSWSRKKK